VRGRAIGMATAAGIALALAAACDGKRAEDPGGPSADCAAERDLAARSLKKWTDLDADAPGPETPLAETASHTADLARTAKEIGAAFGKSRPKRADLAEAAAGVKMLGDLAGKRLEAFAGTLDALAKVMPALAKLEGAANEGASAALGDEALASVGCPTAAGHVGGGDAGPPRRPSIKECDAVAQRMDDLEHPPAPGGFVQAALASRARADGLEALAKAVTALPPAPPKQKARDEEVRRAREAEEAFRALAKALDADAPIEQRLGREREQAEEAATRFTTELRAATELCPAADGGPSASAARSAGPAAPAPASAAPASSAR
jgi:hypothetical protein